MDIGKKLYELRRGKGLTQEQLADELGVTRQTVSKWETGQSAPDFDKLAPLCRLFGVGMDELVGNDPPEGEGEQPQGDPLPEFCYTPREPWRYEYVSPLSIFGLPLVHIHIGLCLCRARGVVAIGNVATGLFSLGIVSVGLIALGGAAFGLLALAGVALGGLALGGIAAGLVALGGLAAGWLALGGLSVGVYSLGGCAIASRVAAGGLAVGHVAIGEAARGAFPLLTGENVMLSAQTIRQTILQEFPGIPPFLLALFSAMGV